MTSTTAPGFVIRPGAPFARGVGAARSRDSVPSGPETLTEREIEVLRLLAEGKANKEIARKLRISEQTVKSHVHSLLAKLGMLSRTQAALYAARIGLVSMEQVWSTQKLTLRAGP